MLGRILREAWIYPEELPENGHLSICRRALLAGTLRIVRGLADGRRHVAEFVFPGQFLGMEPGALRRYAAEAVEAVTALAYPAEGIELAIALERSRRRAGPFRTKAGIAAKSCPETLAPLGISPHMPGRDCGWRDASLSYCRRS